MSRLRILACIMILSLLTAILAGCSFMRGSKASGEEDEDEPRRKSGFFSKDDDEGKKPAKRTKEGFVQEETFDVAGSDYDLRVEYYLNKDFPIPEDVPYNTFDVIKVYEDREEHAYTFEKQESFDNGESIRGVKLIEGIRGLKGILVFRLEDLYIGLQSVLILGDADGKYRELLYDGCYGDYQFKDINSDGSTEILTAASNGGGYVSWWNGFYVAHERSDGVYEASYALTREYYEKLQSEREKAFNKKKTSDNLKVCLEAMAFNGASDAIELLTQEYPDLTAEIDNTLSDEIPFDSYAEYVFYQAVNYGTYWDELFGDDPSYDGGQKSGQGGGKSTDDPCYASIRASGDQEDIILDERQDIDLDGQEEIIIATGSEGEVYGLYCFRMDGDKAVQLEPDGLGGYGIHEVKLIQLEDMPKTYIYCGLTNFVNLYGFMIYEASGNQLKQISYSASATGAGEDSIMDTDGDGQYDYMIQHRYSYDVMYYPLIREFTWNGAAFVPAATRVSLPDYPIDVEEVVLEYLSLRMIDDGLCPDVTQRLKELCTLKDADVPLDTDTWFSGVFYAHLGLDQTKLTSEVKGSQATVTITYEDDDGKTYSLTFLLSVKNDKWRIVKQG